MSRLGGRGVVRAGVWLWGILGLWQGGVIIAHAEMVWNPEYALTIGVVPGGTVIEPFDLAVSSGGDVLVCHFSGRDRVFRLAAVRGGQVIAEQDVLDVRGHEKDRCFSCSIALGPGDEGWLLLGMESLRVARIRWAGKAFEVDPVREIRIGEGLIWRPMVLIGGSRGIVLMTTRRGGEGGGRIHSLRVIVLDGDEGEREQTVPADALMYSATGQERGVIVGMPAPDGERQDEMRFLLLDALEWGLNPFGDPLKYGDLPPTVVSLFSWKEELLVVGHRASHIHAYLRDGVTWRREQGMGSVFKF